MPHLQLGSRRIEYSVVKGASKRYTYFRFKPDLSLEVKIPRGRRVDIDEAIRGRLGWIEREYQRAARARPILGIDEVMFDGSYLRIVQASDQKESVVPHPKSGEVLVSAGDRRAVRELIRRWFLKETSTYVVAKVRESAPLLGVRPAVVDVREIGKWGYCTRAGRLSFSWQLIALSERLREYVVLHELTHLAHFDHSPAFRRKLASVCPDFRDREKDLDLVVPYDRMILP